MSTEEFFSLLQSNWILAVSLCLGSLLFIWFIKRLTLNHLQRIADRSRFYYDSLLISALHLPPFDTIIVLLPSASS